jgi:hypothetical protein
LHRPIFSRLNRRASPSKTVPSGGALYFQFFAFSGLTTRSEVWPSKNNNEGWMKLSGSMNRHEPNTSVVVPGILSKLTMRLIGNEVVLVDASTFVTA